MEALLSQRARTSTSSAIRDLLRLTAAPHILSMAGGLPAADLFPVEGLRAIAGELLADPATAVAALQYGPTEGNDDLRDLVASQSAASSGTPVRQEQVLITTGSQQGLDLLARTLVDAEDVVVVESPSYLGALQALRSRGPNLVPVDADAHGLDTVHLEGMLARGMRPKLCYVVPNFSNPSGATLSHERRRHLAALADRYGFVVVEDDPYGALRFGGSPVQPVRAFGENVVTLGSTSKTLAPGLRVGWAVVPPWLMGPMVREKQAADLHTSTLSQAMVERALRAEWFGAHVATIRGEYARRANALCDAIARHDDALALDGRPDGGMFVWVRLRGEVDASSLLPDALAHGVAFVPGAAFSGQARFHDHVRLSFATLQPHQLHDATDRLAAAVAGRARQAALA